MNSPNGLQLHTIHELYQFVRPLEHFGSKGFERVKLVKEDGAHTLNFCKKRNAMGRFWLWLRGKGKSDSQDIHTAFNHIFTEAGRLVQTLDTQSSDYQDSIHELDDILQRLFQAIQCQKDSKIYPNLQKYYFKLQNEVVNYCDQIVQASSDQDELNVQSEESAKLNGLEDKAKRCREDIKKTHKQYTNVQKQFKQAQAHREVKLVAQEQNLRDAEQDAQDRVLTAQEKAVNVRDFDDRTLEQHESPIERIHILEDINPYAGFLTQEKLDVVLVCRKGEEIYVSHEVLETLSLVFTSMLKVFHSDSVGVVGEIRMYACQDGKKRHQIDFQDYDRFIVEAAWKYYLKIEYAKIKVENLPELLKFANQFDLVELKQECYRLLHLEINSTSKAITWFKQTDDPEILRYCQEIMLKDFKNPIVQKFLCDLPFTKAELYQFLFATFSTLTNADSHSVVAEFLIEWAQSKPRFILQEERDDSPKELYVKEIEVAEVLNADQPSSSKGQIIQDVAETSKVKMKEERSISQLFAPISDDIPYSLWYFVRLKEKEMEQIFAKVPQAEHVQFPFPEDGNFKQMQTDKFDAHFAKGCEISTETPLYGMFTSKVLMTLSIPIPEDQSQLQEQFLSPPFYWMSDNMFQWYQAHFIWDEKKQRYNCGIKKFGEQSLTDRVPNFHGCQVQVNLPDEHHLAFTVNKETELAIPEKYQDYLSLDNMRKDAKDGVFSFKWSIRFY